MNLVDRIRRHFPPKSHVAPGDLCWLRLELGDAHRFPLLNNRECIVLSELYLSSFQGVMKWGHDIEIVGATDKFTALPKVLYKQKPPNSRSEWKDSIWRPKDIAVDA